MMYLLSAEGELSRVDIASMKAGAKGRLPLAETAGKMGNFMEDFLRKFDRDRDKRVSREEFKGPQDLFRRVDRNRDGFLDGKEIETLDRGGGREPRPGGERAVFLCPAETILAVVGPNTLYAFDASSLEYKGHNRFGAPSGTHFERKGRGRGALPAPVAVTEGSTIWILTEDKFLRVSLKSLRVKAGADLGPLASKGDPGDWLALLDRNGDGKVSRDEWRDYRAPPEHFQFADRNRNGVLEKGELKNLPPAPSKSKDAGAERELLLAGDALLVSMGGKLLRFDKKSLEHLGTAELPRKEK